MMGGLAALLLRDGGPVDAGLLQTMLDAVPYRGPDGSGVYVRGHVGLGHALNAVTPEDQGVQQPIVSPRTSCVIIADVRLDDRAELLAKLGNRLPLGASDAELILHGYEEWGDAVVDRLLGDFAFIIWDPRQQRLICARDTQGQRVLFYRYDRRSFAVASEIHQLFQDPAVPIAPNDERILSFLTPTNLHTNEKDSALTFFDGISALPAGHTLVVRRDNQTVRRYWSLTPPSELRYRRDEEYAEHFLELFSGVVRDRLRSSKPMGVLLSGGLDSSSIACVAQELYRGGRAEDHGFKSYSLVFDGLDCDEAGFIQDVQAKYGFEARIFEGARAQGSFELQPTGFREGPNGGARATRDILFAAAEQDGVRVMLSGTIGDSCVYGSRIVFDVLLRQRKLRAFWRHLGAFRRVTDEPLRTTVALAILAPLLPLGLQRRLMAANTRRVLLGFQDRVVPPWIREPYRGDLTRRNLDLAVTRQRQRLFSSPARHAEFVLLDPPEPNRHVTPWNVEMWHPFADRRLQELLFAIPPDQKFEPHPDTDEFYAGSKWLVRRALKGILPESIRTRTTKTTFEAWFTADVARQWSNYEQMFGPSVRSQVAERGYVDQTFFWSGLDELRQGAHRPDLIWMMQVVALEVWLRAVTLPRAQFTSLVRPEPDLSRGMIESDAYGRRGQMLTA